MKIYKRSEEIEFLESLVSSSKSEFIYVRGRRRVGKSWLLDHFTKVKPKRFIFTGQKDAGGRTTLRIFVQEWVKFSKDRSLEEVRAQFLTWHKVFEEVLNYANRSKGLVIVFDEIQWIATGRSGFISVLKEAWIGWQKCGFIKVIVCGSSSKFFEEHTGGEEKILRGLQTRPSLWIHPLPPPDVRKLVFPDWNLQEVAIAYFVTGGVPYYLERIDAKKGFIHGINDSFFLKSGNLQEEIDEILNLEFNRVSMPHIKQVLSTLGQDGTEHKTICKKTGFSKSMVSKLLDKLVRYKIVFLKVPAHTTLAKQNAGTRYFMKDFFLNFYFQVLQPLSEIIQTNKSGLVFPIECQLSRDGYYISNFSGNAFELFVRYYFENKIGFGTKCYQTLMLKDLSFVVLDYWNSQTQIDLVIESKKDRVSRILECKWASSCDSQWIVGVKNKNYPLPEGYTLRHVLIVSCVPSKQFLTLAQQANVDVLSLTDFLS